MRYANDDIRPLDSNAYFDQYGLYNPYQLLGIDADKVAPFTTVYVNLWEAENSLFHVDWHDFTGTEW
jgi:hypothetical protein